MKTLADVPRKSAICVLRCDFTCVSAYAFAPVWLCDTCSYLHVSVCCAYDQS